MLNTTAIIFFTTAKVKLRVNIEDAFSVEFLLSPHT